MSYIIGSLNMKRFGYSSKKDLALIAQIIRDENFDVVGLQEIYSEGKGVQNLKYELPDWDCVFRAAPLSADLTKTKKDPAYSGNEGYAFLWNTRRFHLLEESSSHKVFEPRILNRYGNDVHRDCSFFARTPFYIRLQPEDNPRLEFRLVNTHLWFGSNQEPEIRKRQEEYETLVRDIYPDIEQRRYGDFLQTITVILGDYNLNLPSGNPYQDRNAVIPHPEFVYEDPPGKPLFTITTAQEQLTTLRRQPAEGQPPGEPAGRYANNYDHFTYSTDRCRFSVLRCEAVDAVGRYLGGDDSRYYETISDHLPVLLEIDVRHT